MLVRIRPPGALEDDINYLTQHWYVGVSRDGRGWRLTHSSLLAF